MADAAGRQAGAALFPYASAQGFPWFVSDWGTLAVNPMAREGYIWKQRDVLDFAMRFVVHYEYAGEGDVWLSCRGGL